MIFTLSRIPAWATAASVAFIESKAIVSRPLSPRI